MAYSRPLLAGVALKQTPTATIPAQTGIQQLTLDSEIATTSSLGVVQVGSGLAITPAGVLSATNSGDDFVNVTLTDVNYTITASDYYIGATEKGITITLPLGVLGKVYVIKNQFDGNIKVDTTGGQFIDTTTFKSLGTGSSLMVLFDGTRWNLI